MSEYSTLEKVDEKLTWNDPNSSAIGTFMWLYTIIFWVLGGYQVYRVINNKSELISGFISSLGTALGAKSVFILADITILVVSILFISLVTLIFIRKIAHYVLYFLIGMAGIVSIGFGILLAIETDLLSGAIIIGFGLIMLFILFAKRERLKLAGRALELSADVIRYEKGTLLATMIAMVLTSWTSLSGFLTATFVYDVLASSFPDSSIPSIALIVVLFLSSWAILFQTYFFDGITIGITHAWYRSLKVDVASFSQGLSRAKEVQGSLALFAGIMSLLRAAVQYARKKGGVAMQVIASILGLAEEIIKFITYYTVPSIIIRKTNVRRGIEDSVHMVKEMFIETLVGYFGFAPILYFFGFIYILPMGAIGYLASVYFLVPVYLADLAQYSTGISIANAVVYVVIGLLPLYVIFRTLSVTFKAMLYEFGIDLELAQQGIVLPSRLPIDMKKDFAKVLEEEGVIVPPELLAEH